MSGQEPEAQVLKDLKELLEQPSFIEGGDKGVVASVSEIYKLCQSLPDEEQARVAAALMTINNAYNDMAKGFRDEVQKNAKLEGLATSDELTGLRNRRALKASLTRDVAEAKRYDDGRFVLFAMVDLDGFKRVNDTLGHDAGDQVLVAGANNLRRMFHRKHEVVARYGGDEMCLVLHYEANDNFDPKKIIEKARDAFSSLRWFDEAGNPLALGASVGLARSDEPEFAGLDVSATCMSIIKAADERVYADKWLNGVAPTKDNNVDPDSLVHPKNRRLEDVGRRMRAEGSGSQYDFGMPDPSQR